MIENLTTSTYLYISTTYKATFTLFEKFETFIIFEKVRIGWVRGALGLECPLLPGTPAHLSHTFKAVRTNPQIRIFSLALFFLGR